MKLSMQTVLDFTGAQLRDSGIALAEENADSPWCEVAFHTLVEIAKRKQFFTSEDVRLAMDSKITTHNARAMGGVTVKAIKRRIVERTGQSEPAKNPLAHKCPKAILKSLIFKPQ